MVRIGSHRFEDKVMNHEAFPFGPVYNIPFVNPYKIPCNIISLIDDLKHTLIISH